jgi:hypothetical protein
METETNLSTPPEIQPEEVKTARPAKNKKSKAVNPVGRPPREEKEPAQWTIRGVDIETRNLFEKARNRAGKTAGAFFNGEIREFLQGTVKRTTAQPPATPKDMEIILNERFNQLEANLSTDAIAERVAQIIGAKPETERKGMFQRIVDAIKG